MSQCKTVYLDEKGNKASAYYDNEHLGHDIAYKQYLKYMNTKYKSIRSSNKKYSGFDTIFNQPNNSKLLGIRNMVSESQDDVMTAAKTDEIAENIVFRMKAKEYITKNPIKYNYTIEQANLLLTDNFSIAINPQALDDAKAFYANEQELFENTKKTIKDNWVFHTETGSITDKYLTAFIENFNKSKKESPSGQVILKEIIDNLDVSDISTDDKKEEMKNNVLKLFGSIQKFIESKGITNFEMIPQFKLSNDGLKMQGIMDLVIHDQDTERVIIVDYKFKEKGKEFMFGSTALGKMSGVFKNMFNNKKTQAELQLSGYNLLFEKAGYNPSNIELYILPIVGKPVKENGKIINYEDVKAAEFIPATYRRTELGKFLKSRYKVDINDTPPKEIGKHNSTKELMMDITNGEISEGTYDIELDVNYILANLVYKDPYTDKEYFGNNFLDAKEYFSSDDIEERKIQLRSYLNNLYQDKDKLSNSIIEYFNYGKWPGSQNNIRNSAKILQAKNLLNGIDSKEHTLQQLKNIYGFSDVDPNILIAINNKNKSAKLIYASTDQDTFIKFENDRRTVFGKFLDDSTVEAKYGMQGLDNYKSSFKLLELGILALDLKNKNYISSIDNLISGTVNGNVHSTDEPKVAYMSDIIPQIKVLGEVSKDLLNSSLNSLMNDADLLNPANYHKDNLEQFMDMINISDSYTPLKTEDFKLKIKNSYDAYRYEQISKNDFLNRLGEAQRIMYLSLQPTLSVTDPLLLAKNKEYSLLANAILDVAGFTLDPSALTRKRLVLDKITVTGNFDNSAIQQIYMLDQSTQQEVTRRFRDFASEHEKLINNLKEDYKKRNPIESLNVTNVDQYKMFEELYIENPNKDIKDYNNAFRLKNTKDKSNNLTKAQIEYINFFNENIKKGFMESLETEKKKKIDELWKEGTVPILRATSENKIARAAQFNQKFKEWKDSLKYSGVKRSKKTVDNLFYSVNSDFKVQLSTDSGSQGSKERRKMLEIDSEGKLINPEKNNLASLETNLEHVLHFFVADSLMSKAYQSTFSIFNSLQIKLLLEQSDNFKPTEELRKQIDLYIKLNIFGEYKDEGKTGERLDAVKSIGSKIVMATPKALVLEGMQNMLQYQSFRLSTLFASMTKSDDAFIKNVKSHQTANEYSLLSKTRKDNKSKIAVAVEKEFNLFNGDLTAMKSKEMQVSKKDAIFQSKWLTFLNSLPYKYYLTHTFFVKLVDDGIMDAYTENNGKAIYDVSKDKRFSELFDKNGKMNIDNLSDKGKDQLAYYNSLKKDLSNEYDGINKEGFISRPYSSKEVVVIKDYLMKYYGSMDRNSRIEAHESAMWRAVLMFKNWFPIKIGNYWSPGSIKESKGARVKIMDENEPEGFRYEFKGQWDEGIAQTVYFAYQQVVEAVKQEGLSNFYKGLQNTKYSKHQKANLRRLLSDYLILMAFYLMISTLMDTDLFDNPQGKYLLSIANNSLSDLNIFTSSDSIMNGSPFALYKFLKSTTANCWAVMHYSATGDFDEAIEAGSKLTGATNFIYKIS